MRLRDLATPAAVLCVLLLIYWSEYITTPHPVPGPVHIAYWEKWTGFESDAMRDVVNTFNRSQNKVYVDFLTVSNIERKTLMAIGGGDPPDVAGLYGPNMAQYADDNAVIPLDDYCRKYGVRADQYIPIYWDMGVYNGHVYSLPTTPASSALHYNKAMLRAAGLDDSKPPRTIEELDADAAKITTFDANHKIVKAGFLPAEPGWWNWGWGYVFGGQLWDGKDKITINSPANLRAYHWIQSYTDRFGPSALQSFKSGLGSFSSPQNGFLDGQVAMELQGVWMYNFIDKFAPQMEKPKLDWGAVPFPYPADRPDLADSTFVDEDILVIPRGAKHPDEAFQFIAFVQSQKGMEQLCLGQRKHSPLISVSADFYRTHPNPFIKLFADLANGKNAISPPKMGIWPEYQSELTNAFDEVTAASNRKTPEEVLAKVQTVMQAKLDEYNERLRLRGKQTQRGDNSAITRLASGGAR